MRIISRRSLREFWGQPGKQGAESPLRAWYDEVRQARWRSPADVKAVYRSASIIGDGRVVFNVGGNRYRVVVAVKYSAQIVFIRFVGSHAEYDDIDAREV